MNMMTETAAANNTYISCGVWWVTGSENQFRKFIVNLKNFSNQARTKHSCRRYGQAENS